MADPNNPFELQPQVWGGMPQLVPQEGGPQEIPLGGFGGLQGGEGGSYFELSPQAMQMMWAPPQQQVQLPPLPPPQV